MNTILPGTHVSLVVNFGDEWACGRSLATSMRLPRVCVVGPVTQSKIVRLGKAVHAVGAVVAPTLTHDAFGVPAAALVDQIVSLQDLWSRDNVERLLETLSRLHVRPCVSALRDELTARITRSCDGDTVEQAAARFILSRGGRVSIERIARSQGLSRQRFARQFGVAAGLPPKLFARVTRFQKLVPLLLNTDVSEWVSVASATGFYDQAHMINEFRAFAGSSPTVFFRPHGDVGESTVAVRGRPGEWLQRPHSDGADQTLNTSRDENHILSSTPKRT